MIDFKVYEINGKMKLGEFCKIIFHTHRQAEIGEIIIRHFLDSKITEVSEGFRGFYYSDFVMAKNMESLCKECKCTKPTIYAILKQMLELGILKKDFNFMHLSDDFPKALQRLIKSYRRLK